MKTKTPAGALRLRLLLAYDGCAFEGWQSQPSGRTVQDALEKAVENLVGKHCVVHGSGRTDSGVHATGQVAHVDVPEGRLPLGAWEGALNGNLPRTLRVLEARKAASGFHARFSATGKTYLYRVWNDKVLHPLELGRAWHVPSAMDGDSLRLAAERLEGCHDFAAFAANRGRPEESTVRTITQIRVRQTGSLLTLKFEGDGFLYRMVRLLTGTMIRMAQGKESLEWLEAFVNHPTLGKTSFCAPAEGLYLARVAYGRQRRADKTGA